MTHLPTLAEIMAMFIRFELVYGWTSPNPEVDQDGNKFSITAVEDDWSFRDRWRSGSFVEEGWAYGHTALSYKNTDLIVIQFQGYYTEDAVQRVVIPAINRTYQAGIFYGGRGMSFDTDNLLYENEVSGISYSPHGEFFDAFEGDPRDARRIIDFHGREHVKDYSGGFPGVEIGFHKYQGGLLVPESLIRA
ncbi:MAG: hypothetical protein WC451_02810 [Patescibacteria group bacterium]